jgi:hypothetical protein
MEIIGNLAGRPRPAAQKVEDVAPRLVSERAEGGIGRPHGFHN